MSFGKRFQGRKGWCIRVWTAGNYAAPEFVWTNASPGPIKKDIILEHNSVGACIAGQLTFDGFCGWRPRSRVVEIFDGPVPLLANRLGMGIVGIVRGTKGKKAGRTATVPLLGLHTRDENGLSEFGFSQIGPFVSAAIYILGSYYAMSNTPRRFGLTNDAAIKELFGDRVDSSWGVRPDGLRVAGYAGASGTISVPVKDEQGNDTWATEPLALDALQLNADAPHITYEDSGYEEPSFITEAQWRMDEKHAASSIRRPDNGLVPRRGSSGETGTGELQPGREVLQAGTAAQTDMTMGGAVRGVNLPALIMGSLKNPNAFGAMYETVGVGFDVTIEATFAENEKDTFEDADFAGNNTERPAEQYAYIEWAEWLATAPEEPKVKDTSHALPTIEIDDKNPATAKKVASNIPIKDGNGFVKDLQTVDVPVKKKLTAKADPFTMQETVIDPHDIFRYLAHNYATLTPARNKFIWHFAAPDALLTMVDASVPTVQYEADVQVTEYVNGVPVTKTVKQMLSTSAYQWCCGVAFTATRQSTKISMTVGPITHLKNEIHPPGMPDFPGYNLPFHSDPTFTGTISGELVYGPVILNNLRSASGEVFSQPLTNTRMVIGTASRRTEFQTAAAQRTSNGTAQNMTNDRSFGYYGGH